ncbi:hypothetical protein CDEF62S_02907 [Castellaniella defragrans]
MRVTPAHLAACAAAAWFDALDPATGHGVADLPQRYAQVDGLSGKTIDVPRNSRKYGMVAGTAVDARNTRVERIVQKPAPKTRRPTWPS